MFFFQVSGLPSNPESKKYRFPLNINNGYSSSFQEFRSNHFHAGMDLRTFRRTGYPVYAIADGKLVKIRMVKRGSGRGLYLKHNDGYTSIYFHLDRFNSRIESVVEKVQQARKRKYFGNYILKNPITVKQGEVIAYSGETGYGFPHLHLEIRDPQYAAVNPFPLVSLPGKDDHFPVLRFLIFRNKSQDLVNGHIGESLIKFKKQGSGVYRLNRPVVATGHLDCLLSARDISDTGKYVAPYEISLRIGSRHFYHLRFDRFRWADNNQLGFVYDMAYSSPGNYLFNLFFQKGFGLESTRTDPDLFIDQLDPGEHDCRVEVTDNFGNTSTGHFRLIKMKTPRLEVKEISPDGGSITLDDVVIRAPGCDRLVVCLMDPSGDEAFRGEIELCDIGKNRQLILTGIDGPVGFMDFLFFKEGIVYHRNRIRLNADGFSPGEDIDFSTFINRDRVFFELKNPLLSTGDLNLIISQGTARQTVKALDSNGSIFFMYTPLATEPDVTLDFSFDRDGDTVKSIRKKIRLICLEEGQKRIFKDGEFSAEFHQHAVNEPKVLLFETRQYPSEYPVLSRQISLYPTHFPFLDYVYFRFRKSVPRPLQVGIFRYRAGKKKWRYVSTRHDNATHTFQTRVISSGVFALMRDVYPPLVSLQKVPTRFLTGVKRLFINISDRGKGVNDDTLAVVINNRVMDCEYDPDRRHVKLDPSRILRKGKNTIRVRVADHGGNKTSKVFSLFLK